MNNSADIEAANLMRKMIGNHRMTIEQIIKYLPAPMSGATVIGKEMQKYYDAHDLAIIILRKYQKIKEIVKNTQQLCSYGSAFIDIREVVEDGNDD